MAEIVLVTPPVTLEERYGKLSGAANTLPSLGMLYLAAVLRKEGHSVSVIEASSLGLSLKELLGEIVENKPKYLGISSTTLSIFHASALADEIKNIDRNIKTIIGGPHLTAIPEETMGLFKSFDFGVIGEGEETVRELIHSFNRGRNGSDVSGIICREGDKTVRTAPRKFLDELDRLPFPAWDLLKDFPKKYHPPPFRFKRLPAVYIVTTRGCPYKCIFCDRSVFGNKCRGHSCEYILELIEYLYNRFGIREILIEDDTFVTFKKRLIEVCEGIIRRGIKINWSCLARADAVTPEILSLMKKAGCWSISYGIETGDKEVMKFIGKNITLDKVEHAVRLTKKAGILSKGFFIIGHPIDTHDTIKKTVDFALRIPLDDISVSMMTPFPGSKLHKIAAQYGEFENNWKKMNELDVVFIPKGLTKNVLEGYSREFLKRFYLRPDKITNYIGRIAKNPKSLPLYIKGFSAFLKKIAR
jgi:anaerobic magnesium-protoporphyrin IX monomethyl ester cyclase